MYFRYIFKPATGAFQRHFHPPEKCKIFKVCCRKNGKYKTEHKCIVRLRGKQRYLEEARNLDDQLGNIKVFNLICQKPILPLSSDPEYKIALCFQTDQWPYRVLKNRLVHMADFLVLCNAVFCSKEMQILKANRKTGLY